MPGIPVLPIEQIAPPVELPSTAEPIIVEPAGEDEQPAERAIEPMPEPAITQPISAVPRTPNREPELKATDVSLTPEKTRVPETPRSMPENLLNPAASAIERSAQVDLTSWLNGQAQDQKAARSSAAQMPEDSIGDGPLNRNVVRAVDEQPASTAEVKPEPLPPLTGIAPEAANPSSASIEIGAPAEQGELELLPESDETPQPLPAIEKGSNNYRNRMSASFVR